MELAHQLSNKEITISNQIYGTLCPKTNVCSTVGKPARYRRVAVDSKGRRRIENHDTITNPIGSDPTTITIEQRLEIAETYRPPKRY